MALYFDSNSSRKLNSTLYFYVGPFVRERERRNQVRLPPRSLRRRSSFGAWHTALRHDSGCCSHNTSTSASRCVRKCASGSSRPSTPTPRRKPPRRKSNAASGPLQDRRRTTPDRSDALMRGNASATRQRGSQTCAAAGRVVPSCPAWRGRPPPLADSI